MGNDRSDRLIEQMKVSDISSEVRAEIDDFLLAHNFSRYRELSRLLRAQHGVRLGKSTLHEWGKAFRKEYQAATVRARAITAGIGDGTPMSTRALERLAAELTEAAEAQRKKRNQNRRRERRRVKSA